MGTGAGPAWGELSAARFVLGVAGGAAGWAALASRHPLFPSREPGALLAPSCPAQGRDPLSCQACRAAVSPAARAEVGCFHPWPCWVSSGAGGSSVDPYHTVLGAGHSWGAEQLPTESLMSTRGETEAREGSRTCPRTTLELGVETSHALTQGLWTILGAGCGGDPWDGSWEQVPPTTGQAAGNSATAWTCPSPRSPCCRASPGSCPMSDGTECPIQPQGGAQGKVTGS